MKEVKPITRALVLLTLALVISACGKSTSKSSSGQSSPQPQPEKPIENNLDPIELSPSNYTQIASQSLKSLLLNEAGTNALSQSVTVTTQQNSEIAADMVSGVIFTLAPYPCTPQDGIFGNFSLRATVNNTNSNNVQLDLNSPLRMVFDARFNECRLDATKLDGDVSMTFETNFAQLLGGQMYNLVAEVDVQGLSVDPVNLPDFVFDGTFDYKLSNNDGVNENMEVRSRNSAYFTNETFQLFELDLVKSVNNLTQVYSYSVSSEFTDSANPNAYVAYETQVPLSGTGFSPPTSGRVVVYGTNGKVLIHALREQTLLVQLDLGDDGTIDNQYTTTWEELVFNSFGAVTN